MAAKVLRRRQRGRQHMHDAQCLAGIVLLWPSGHRSHSMAHKHRRCILRRHIIHGCADAMYPWGVIQFNARDERAKTRYAFIKLRDILHLEGNTGGRAGSSNLSRRFATSTTLPISHRASRTTVRVIKSETSPSSTRRVLREGSRGCSPCYRGRCTPSNPRKLHPGEMEQPGSGVYFDLPVEFPRAGLDT